ncbi:type II toxin-antitoxin system VapC family toxin [Aquibium oceanicum]|uniref:Ribonuclease VapC n=1 Tax=Aquibium oceanicum TaxID=1670800 RepID=A0A1L3SN28_9HYPH|nr:type II toxin-antitoxin system VapC family toxin [Aquibium oceanicum]APH70809.1 VapC toxin family PIN domain ribonuclease [Aquibium oceanicum]
MIVLDTNILSELQKPKPDSGVRSWFASVAAREIRLCGPVVMEQAYGAELFRVRTGSTRYSEAFRRTLHTFSDRVLHFDGGAPELAGRLRASRDALGRPVSIGDAMIASICLVHGATLATRNVRDFDGLDLAVVNPFEAGE